MDKSENVVDPGLPHFMTGAQLQAILIRLKPTDELYPNEVRNLAILREGKYIGFVNFLNVGKVEPHLELVEGEEG